MTLLTLFKFKLSKKVVILLIVVIILIVFFGVGLIFLKPKQLFTFDNNQRVVNEFCEMQKNEALLRVKNFDENKLDAESKEQFARFKNLLNSKVKVRDGDFIAKYIKFKNFVKFEKSSWSEKCFRADFYLVINDIYFPTEIYYYPNTNSFKVPDPLFSKLNLLIEKNVNCKAVASKLLEQCPLVDLSHFNSDYFASPYYDADYFKVDETRYELLAYCKEQDVYNEEPEYGFYNLVNEELKCTCRKLSEPEKAKEERDAAACVRECFGKGEPDFSGGKCGCVIP